MCKRYILHKIVDEPWISVFLIIYENGSSEAPKAKNGRERFLSGRYWCMNSKLWPRPTTKTELLRDVTAHAEILAISAGSGISGKQIPENCTLFVTLEPCVMCAGALRWVQLRGWCMQLKMKNRGFMRHGKSILHKTKVSFGPMKNRKSLNPF